MLLSEKSRIFAHSFNTQAYERENIYFAKSLRLEQNVIHGGPANEEEAITRIEAIEADYERTGISYSLEEVIAESHKRHPWLG